MKSVVYNFNLYLLILCTIKVAISQECGTLTVSKATGKIHFPWTAEIFSKFNKTKSGTNDKRICGATVIASSYGITAAHCFQEKQSEFRRAAESVYLLANVIDLKHVNDSQTVELKDVIIHPEWNAKDKKYEGDIAVLRFKAALEFNEKIKPICLWQSTSAGIESASRGKVITFVSLEEDDPGFYNHFYDDDSHNYAQIYDMPIRAECIESQPRFREIASNSTFCAGGLNSVACLEQGTSGSSMAVEIEGKFYLRGIVSASFIDFAGCDNYTYTLFTDAFPYADWINSVTII